MEEKLQTVNHSESFIHLQFAFILAFSHPVPH